MTGARDHRDAAAITRRRVLAGGLMSLGAAGAFAATPHRSEHSLARHKLSDLVARQIGPWMATTPAGVIIPTEEVNDSDGYDQQLARVYAGAGLPTIMMLIAYGSTQGGSLRLHRPETCYPAQGFRLDKFRDIDFSFRGNVDVHARTFTAAREERVERLVYWTRIAQGFPRTTLEEYGFIVKSVLRGVVPDGILVRLSTVGASNEAADDALREFAETMVAATNTLGRQILVGAG